MTLFPFLNVALVCRSRVLPDAPPARCRCAPVLAPSPPGPLLARALSNFSSGDWDWDDDTLEFLPADDADDADDVTCDFDEDDEANAAFALDIDPAGVDAIHLAQRFNPGRQELDDEGWAPHEYGCDEGDRAGPAGTEAFQEMSSFVDMYKRSRDNSLLLHQLRVLQTKGVSLTQIEDRLIELRRENPGKSEPNRVKIFNYLLREWLTVGNLPKSRGMFRGIQSECTPDGDSYVLLLLCHALAHANGAVNKAETTAKVRASIQQMQRHGHSLMRLSQSFELTDTEAQLLTKTVRLVWPDFALPSGPAPAPTDDSRDAQLIREQWEHELGINVGIPLPRTKSWAEPKTIRRKRVGLKAPDDQLPRHADTLFGRHALEVFLPVVTDALAKARREWTESSHDINKNGIKRPGNLTPADYMFAACSDVELAELVLGVMDQFLTGSQNGAPCYHVNFEVGEVVYKKHFVETVKRNMDRTQSKQIYAEYASVMRTEPRAKPREVWAALLEKHNVHPGTLDIEGAWPAKTLRVIGHQLVNVVLEVANASKIGAEINYPAFHLCYEYDRERICRHIRPHPLLAHSAPGVPSAHATADTKSFRTTLLPMLTPPKPWTSTLSTPMFVTPRSMVRCETDAFEHHGLLARAEGQMAEVYDALNYLGSCPWQVNDFVFQQQLMLYHSEEGFEDLAIPPLDVPRQERVAREELFNLSPMERRDHEQSWEKYRKEKNENLSLRGDLVNKMAIAQAYRGKTFYLPHNLDFRGRTYTMGPYLSHLGDDKTRGLLKFAEAKPLGAAGLRWLKIHTSNLFGVDKVSFEERVEYIDANIDAVLDSARAPFGPPIDGEENKFWRMSENPWQTLAACEELRAAIDSGDPESYASSLPIHQDGTCNGLQHYAALGCDPGGAAAVNLSSNPEDKPADVYMRVTDKVNELLRAHAAGDFSSVTPAVWKVFSRSAHLTGQDDPTGADPLAAVELTAFAQNLLDHEGGIGRKIVKQSVMTSVYGVTPFGARQQIKKQLRAKGYLAVDDQYDAGQLVKGAAYLAEMTFASLDIMFEQANTIKRWLGDAAYEIALSGRPVQWVTPLNFPVIQQYSRPTKVAHVQTGMAPPPGPKSGRKLVEVDLPTARKQMSAFPPNFIHSLDSTHMMMTANACNTEGVRFVSVHDSYWTHAATTDEMNLKLRHSFIRLHESPILARLHQYMAMYHNGDPHLEHYTKRNGTPGEVSVPPPPEKGSFDLKKVLDSRYFFN